MVSTTAARLERHWAGPMADKSVVTTEQRTVDSMVVRWVVTMGFHWVYTSAEPRADWLEPMRGTPLVETMAVARVAWMVDCWVHYWVARTADGWEDSLVEQTAARTGIRLAAKWVEMTVLAMAAKMVAQSAAP